MMRAERGLLLRMRTVEGPPYTTFSGLFENARHERAKAFPAKRLAAMNQNREEKQKRLKKHGRPPRREPIAVIFDAAE